jgi:hypothetical protein
MPLQHLLPEAGVLLPTLSATLSNLFSVSKFSSTQPRFHNHAHALSITNPDVEKILSTNYDNMDFEPGFGKGCRLEKYIWTLLFTLHTNAQPGLQCNPAARVLL